jgi:hypothetical protein
VWLPGAPTLLCGGDADPTVFFGVNTGTMVAFWAASPTPHAPVLEFDVGGTNDPNFPAIQTAFQASQAAQLAYYQTAAGGGLSPAAAQMEILQNYHVSVAPFCALAVRYFFANF